MKPQELIEKLNVLEKIYLDNVAEKTLSLLSISKFKLSHGVFYLEIEDKDRVVRGDVLDAISRKLKVKSLRKLLLSMAETGRMNYDQAEYYTIDADRILLEYAEIKDKEGELSPYPSVDEVQELANINCKFGENFLLGVVESNGAFVDTQLRSFSPVIEAINQANGREVNASSDLMLALREPEKNLNFFWNKAEHYVVFEQHCDAKEFLRKVYVRFDLSKSIDVWLDSTITTQGGAFLFCLRSESTKKLKIRPIYVSEALSEMQSIERKILARLEADIDGAKISNFYKTVKAFKGVVGRIIDTIPLKEDKTFKDFLLSGRATSEAAGSIPAASARFIYHYPDLAKKIEYLHT